MNNGVPYSAASAAIEQPPICSDPSSATEALSGSSPREIVTPARHGASAGGMPTATPSGRPATERARRSHPLGSADAEEFEALGEHPSGEVAQRQPAAPGGLVGGLDHRAGVVERGECVS